MDDGSRSWLFAVILLLLLAMYFAMAETAFASVTRAKLSARQDSGDPRARKALFVLDHFDRAITTILICTNIVHLSAASIVTVNVTRIWGSRWVTLSTVVTTLVVFFFGEMLPKSIARKYSERLSLYTASVISFLMTVFKPASSFLTAVGNALTRSSGESEASVTEDELQDIIEDMTEEGTLDEQQGGLISSALQFSDMTVESILTSRVDMVAVDSSMNTEEIMDFIKRSNHSRLPVYQGTVDNIIGVLQIRTFMKEYFRNDGKVELQPLLEPPYFVHQSMKIDDALHAMSLKKETLALVTDNYGGIMGVVTVEDILEELVGEIWDEDDRVVENIVPLPDGTYSVNAEEHVLDVFEDLDIDVPEDMEEELANKQMSELCFEHFETIPKPGDSFWYMGAQITILVMRRNRIIRLKFRKPDVEKEPENTAHSLEKAISASGRREEGGGS